MRWIAVLLLLSESIGIDEPLGIGIDDGICVINEMLEIAHVRSRLVLVNS